MIEGKIVGEARNSSYSENSWASHAELKLIKEYSTNIKDQIKNNGSTVELYTTLEPCLMCLGASVLNRVGRIVFACPDPYGGATSLNVKNLPDFYARKWPTIEGGLLKEESYKLMVEFMKSKNADSWKKMLRLFEDVEF